MIGPPLKASASWLEPSNFGSVKPNPLIQYLVARSTVGYVVSLQSATLLTTLLLSGSAIGRADSLSSRAKNSLKVLYLVESGWACDNN